MIAPPERGRVFSLPMRPGLADCAPSGRARLDALARWLQDIAYADVEDAGLADAAVWVVRRTRICVQRFPRFAEALTGRTFCSGTGRAWAERRTSIHGPGKDGASVEAVSLWVHLDPADWRPMPFSEAELEVYGEAAAARRVTARLRHPPPADRATTRSWTFRATELDVANHVNNTAYWQPLEEELLAGPEPSGADVELEYRTPSQPGTKLILADGEWRWIIDEGGEVHASARLSTS